MVTLTDLIQQHSDRYSIANEDAFLDLMAYFLKASSACISLASLKSDKIIKKIILRSNSINDKSELEKINKNIKKIIDFILNILKWLRGNDEILLIEIQENFFQLIIQQKIEKGADLLDDSFKNEISNNDNIQNKKFIQDKIKECRNDCEEIKEMFVGVKTPTDLYSNLIQKIFLRWKVFLKFIQECKERFSEDIEFYLDVRYPNINDINLNMDGIHSELLVLSDVYFYFSHEQFEQYFPKKENNNLYTYIGCSFRCCPCCAIYIQLINSIEQHKIQIRMCGQHGKFFANWSYPPFECEREQLLIEFIGFLDRKIYQKELKKLNKKDKCSIEECELESLNNDNNSTGFWVNNSQNNSPFFDENNSSFYNDDYEEQIDIDFEMDVENNSSFSDDKYEQQINIDTTMNIQKSLKDEEEISSISSKEDENDNEMKMISKIFDLVNELASNSECRLEPSIDWNMIMQETKDNKIENNRIIIQSNYDYNPN